MLNGDEGLAGPVTGAQRELVAIQGEVEEEPRGAGHIARG